MVRGTWFLLVIAFLVYTVFVYCKSDPVARHPPSVSVNAGWNTWQDKNCQGCHQLYGLGGYLGPDLTNCYSLKGPDYMQGIIEQGTAKMPAPGLTKEEVKNLIAFLQWVDKSGRTRVDAKNVHWSGTYIMDHGQH